MKRTLLSVVTFLLTWQLVYRLIIYMIDFLPYGWADLIGFVLLLVGFALNLVIAKKLTDYLTDH